MDSRPNWNHHTFDEALQAYLEAGGERRYATPDFKKLCGAKHLCEIDNAWIKQVAETLKPHASPSTRERQVFTLISAVLKFAVTKGWCERFVVERPEKIKREQSPLPSQEELKRFLSLAGPSLRQILRFKLDTDATEYEILTLDWSNVNVGSKQALLQRADGNTRIVSLSSETAVTLAKSMNQNGRVFRSGNGRPYNIKSSCGGRLKTAFYGASKRSGVTISFLTLHRICCARRSDATRIAGSDSHG